LLPITFLVELGTVALNFFAVPAYLREDLEFSERYVGLVLAAYLISESLFKSVVGHYADRFGRRRFLLYGPLIWSATPILTMAIPASWGSGLLVAILMLRIADGLAAAMVWTSAYAMMGDATSDAQRSQGMSLLNVCFMAGLALGFVVGGEANALANSYKASFGVASCLFLLASGLTLLTIRAERGPDGALAEEDHRFGDIFACFRKVPMVFILGFITFLAIGLPAPVLMFFAKDIYHVDVNAFGRTLAMPAAAMLAVLSLPMGSAAERIGHRRAVDLGLLACLVGLVVIGAGKWSETIRHFAFVIPAAALVGIGFLLALPAWYAIVSRIDPKRSGLYLGSVMAVQGFGAIIGTLLGARLYESDPFAPGLGAAACLLVALVLATVVPTSVETKNGNGEPDRTGQGPSRQAAP
jgi:DHA1 family multidrug resistance protein-like MFS transporter